VTCRHCRTALRPETSPQLPGQPHAGRGLCRLCYRHAAKHGQLDRFPAVRPGNRHLVEDYLELAAQGYTRKQAAERLGVRRDTLDAALRRDTSARRPAVSAAPTSALTAAPDWQAHAACTLADAPLFDADTWGLHAHHGDAHWARAAGPALSICAACPVTAQCAEQAVADRWTGVAGGVLLRDGKAVTARRRAS
jgi:hypothetical protein